MKSKSKTTSSDQKALKKRLKALAKKYSAEARKTQKKIDSFYNMRDKEISQLEEKADKLWSKAGAVEDMCYNFDDVKDVLKELG